MSIQQILVLAETIDIETTSAGKANMGFIQSLLAQGFKVRVLHYSHKEIQIPNAEVQLVREQKADNNYFLSRGQRVLQRITGKNFSKAIENRFGFSFTFKNDASSMARAMTQYCDAADIIITLSKGASYRTHAALLQLPKAHYKWLAYMHDPYPFHLYPPPYNWTEAGHEQKEAFFKKVSKKAAYSGFPSKLLKEWMGQYFPNFLKTGLVLPHQDVSEVTAVTQPPAYFDTAKFSLLHAGNLLGYRNPFPLIEAYKLFLDKNHNAKQDTQLLFLGPADYHEPAFTETCKALSTVYKSDGYVDFKEVYHIQKHASVNIIIEADAEVSPFLPGKFPHCIQANNPILLLSPVLSECNRLLGPDYPYSALPSDVVGISEMITALYFKWKENAKGLQLDREDIVAYFTSDYLAKQLHEIAGE